MKSASISLIIGPRGLGWKTNLYEIMDWESFGVVEFDLGLITRLLLVLEVCNVKPT